MIPAGVQVFEALEPVDMRCGFERLSAMVRERMGYEPRSGALFVFVGRRRQLVKIVFADATGICVFAKRLDKGVFCLPASPASDAHRSRRGRARRPARRPRAHALDRDDNATLSPSARALKAPWGDIAFGLDSDRSSEYKTRVLDAPSAKGGQDDERVVAMANELTSLRNDNVSLRDELSKAKDALAHLRVRYHRLLEELHLLKRRLVVAKAERLDDVADAQLAFDKLLAETQAIKNVLDACPSGEQPEAPPPAPSDKPRERTRKTPPTGRRDLSKCNLPEVRVELADPLLEGKAERIGVDESSRVAFERGGYRRLVMARVVYKESVHNEPRQTDETTDGRTAAATTEPTFRIVTAPMPKEIVPRGMLAPSMIAHVLAIKYLLGVPFYRYEKQCALEGFALDRGTMCRYAEHVGATLGCIVEAARKEAIATAFCLSTDATGVAIQPTPLADGKR